MSLWGRRKSKYIDVTFSNSPKEIKARKAKSVKASKAKVRTSAKNVKGRKRIARKVWRRLI